MSFDSRKLQGPPYRNTKHAQKPIVRTTGDGGDLPMAPPLVIDPSWSQ